MKRWNLPISDSVWHLLVFFLNVYILIMGIASSSEALVHTTRLNGVISYKTALSSALQVDNFSLHLNFLREYWTWYVPVRAMKIYMGSRGMAPLIPNLCTRWRWVLNITPGRFTPGIEQWYPLNRRCTEPLCGCGRFAEEKKSYPCRDLKPRPPSPLC